MDIHSDKVENDVEMEDVSPEQEVLEKKISSEEYIRSGFAKHDGDVDRISEVFDKVVWPALEGQGWMKVRRWHTVKRNAWYQKPIIGLVYMWLFRIS